MTNARLILLGTPIGDLADAPPSLAAALLSADVIAAEDTRRLRRLTERLGINPQGRVVSYFDGNEVSRTAELAGALQEGQQVVVVTDAGMPSVSDPGYRLVRAAINLEVPVSAVPGPSAVLTALAVSGLAVDRFCFEGFLPRKAGERRRRLARLAGEERTMVFFEAPHRLADFLADAVDLLGALRPAAVCRELTKTYEETRRGTLAELAEWACGELRGEITVVIEGQPQAVDPQAAVSRVLELLAEGVRLKQAAAEVAEATGLSRNGLYRDALAARDSAGSVDSRL